jgi:IMP dehydrogenase
MKFKLRSIESLEVRNYVGKVYDLTVENDHSYNVNKVVVHNSACETRQRTKIGIPQATALIDCSFAAEESDITIISDGGHRLPGDIALAIALGAKGVMLGSILSGTKETPGEIMKEGPWPNEKLYKVYMGSASFAAKMSRNEQTKNIEGTSMRIPYKGKVKRIVNDINDGVRSSMSYVGARNINEFQLRSEFVNVTSSGIVEASPHGVTRNGV